MSSLDKNMWLETPCERCGANGTIYNHAPHLPERFTEDTCPDCDGHGLVPTEFGDDVLEFVKRRLFPKES